MPKTSRPSRRSVLLSGGTLALTTLTGCIGSIQGNNSSQTDKSGGKVQEIRLGAKKEGWMGRAPKSIEGKQNPTVPLKAGQKYKLTWKNLDGLEHELIILDKNGNNLKKSDDAEKKGKTVTMTFTASKEISKYKCEYHPKMMRGQIKFSSG